MTQKIGRALRAIGFGGFVAIMGCMFYLKWQVGKFPLQPDPTHGYVFAEASGRGEPQHYVPYALHMFNQFGSIAVVLAFAIGMIGYRMMERGKGGNSN